MEHRKTGEPATLEDILNYRPENYWSDEEVSLIQSTFGGVQGNKLLKILRKALLPTMSDPELPIEKLADDNWMAGVDFKGMSIEEIKPIVMGRQEAIKTVMGALIQLSVMVNSAPITPAKQAERNALDSAK